MSDGDNCFIPWNKETRQMIVGFVYRGWEGNDLILFALATQQGPRTLQL